MRQRNDEPRRGDRGMQGRNGEESRGYGRPRGDDERWDQRDLGTRGGDYGYPEQDFGHQGAGGRSFRELPRGSSEFGSGQGFGPQDYSRNDRYAQERYPPDRYPPDRYEPGGYEGGGYTPRGFRAEGSGSPGGFARDSYASGRDFGGQGGYGGGYGASQGGPGRSSRGEDYGRGGYGAATRGGSLVGPSFRGKGPKGYVRSDERLREDICERLTDDHEIDASDVSVQARGGVVTLEGTVGARAIKHRIEDIVEQCGGVSDIRNHLTVKPREYGGRDGGSVRGESAGDGGGAGTAGNRGKQN